MSAAYIKFQNYRNMTLYKLPSGNLLIHCPIALPEPTMSSIEILGEPELIMIPNSSKSSMVDVLVYKNRYPQAKVICPQILSKELGKFIQIDGTTEDELESKYKDLNLLNPPMNSLNGIFLNK